MHVGIEPRRMRPLESFKERLLVAAVPDVIANVIGIRERQNDEVMSFAIAKRARTGCLRLFVFGLDVNDGSSGFACIFTDPFPDTHHVPASGIDHLAAAVLDLL